MKDDGELLRHFAETRDEACFRELVDRRIGFVYAVALRQLRDPHLAEEAPKACSSRSPGKPLTSRAAGTSWGGCIAAVATKAAT